MYKKPGLSLFFFLYSTVLPVIQLLHLDFSWLNLFNNLKTSNMSTALTVEQLIERNKYPFTRTNSSQIS